ncbi:hypothetical protein Tco_0260855 [Tanacetum coccineum]
MDEVHSTVQIPPLFEELTSDKSMQDIILHQIRHDMVNSSRLSFYLDLFSPEDNFGSLSSDSFKGPPPVGPPLPNNNGPPSVVRPNGPAPQSVKELCQPSINGRGGPIAPIPIQATDFRLRYHMIQQV